MNSYQNGKWEDKTPGQQIKRTDARSYVSESRQDCDIGCDVPKTEIMESSQDGRNGEMGSRSEQISHRKESP